MFCTDKFWGMTMSLLKDKKTQNWFQSGLRIRVFFMGRILIRFFLDSRNHGTFINKRTMLQPDPTTGPDISRYNINYTERKNFRVNFIMVVIRSDPDCFFEGQIQIYFCYFTAGFVSVFYWRLDPDTLQPDP